MTRRLLVLVTFLTILGARGLLADDAQPVAMITELKGKVEVNRGGSWSATSPLLPLYAGDMIRVGPHGKAVVVNLGLSTEVITEATSPYKIKETAIGEGQASKLYGRMKSAFIGLFRKEETKTASLITRGPKDGITLVLPPPHTEILFPKDRIMFEWEASNPPYHLRICRGLAAEEQEPVFEKDVWGNDLSVPGQIFKDSLTYEWTMSSEQKEETGAFTFVKREESEALRNELSALVQKIPEEHAITQIVVQYVYLIDHRLNYDAEALLRRAEKTYPESEALKKLRMIH